MEEAETKTVNDVAVSHREQINSAIGTWSGFIYQGLCGILVSLRMIEADREGTVGYKLQLDGYEDFSILDDKDQIVSLHQCKSIKGRKDYKEDLKKMKLKRDEYTNLRTDVKSYFHCNEKVTIDATLSIEAYPFKVGQTNCGPGELKSIIKEEVEKLKKPESDNEVILNRLEALVNSNVLKTQQIFFDTDEKLYVISRKRYVSFADITTICFATFLRLEVDDILTIIKSRYIEQFQERIDVNGGMDNIPNMESFIMKFANMNQDEMRLFMQRIHPMEKFDYSFGSLLNVSSNERIDLLYNLIQEFPLDEDGLHWITTNSKQTPSTLADIKEIKHTCRKIYENRANFDAMWIYDWFVGRIDGKVTESVKDIRKMASQITEVEESESERSIFHEKTVGIMTINDKRNGKFD